MNGFSIKSSKSKALKGKSIALCITGSVACVQSPLIARELIRHGAEVHPVMSESAQKLLGPYLVQWACENDVVTELTGRIEHVHLGAGTDLVLVCPSTANTLSKIACGIDDTTVTSTVTCALGEGTPIIVVPAMHLSMYNNKAVAENLKKLESIGIQIIKPKVEEDKAKIAWDEVVQNVINALTTKDLTKQIVITGGPTYEKIDSCRGIMNRSSGKMACAIARNALSRGAQVTFVYGPGKEKPPQGIKLIRVTSTKEMTEKALEAMKNADALISVAAIADYTPKTSENKIKSNEEELSLQLTRNEKLVKLSKKRYPNKPIVGFKLEQTINKEKALELTEELDIVVANSIEAIDSDKTKVFLTNGKENKELEAGKDEVAEAIIDELRKKL